MDEIDPKNKAALGVVWERLKALLDSHAEAEERFFYPDLLKIGTGAADADTVEDMTEDAIEDHNEIRDTGDAVQKHNVGTKKWFAAIADCNVANSKHMGEEERQALTDFRRHASFELRHKLAVQFLEFQCAHLNGVKAVNKDPDDYIEDPKKTMKG